MNTHTTLAEYAYCTTGFTRARTTELAANNEAEIVVLLEIGVEMRIITFSTSNHFQCENLLRYDIIDKVPPDAVLVDMICCLPVESILSVQRFDARTRQFSPLAWNALYLDKRQHTT